MASAIKLKNISWELLGFGLAQLAYIEALKLLQGLGGDGAFCLNLYWLSAAVACAAVGLVARAGVKAPHLRVIALAVAVVQTALGFVFLAADELGAVGAGLTVTYAVLLGMGCALLWALWQDRLAEYGGTEVFFYVAACALAMAFFHLASTLLSQVIPAFLVLSQVGSIALLLCGLHDGQWAEPRQGVFGRNILPVESFLSPRSAVLMILLFSFSYYFATETVFSATMDLFRDLEDFISAGFMFAMFFAVSRCSFVNVLRAGIPVMIVFYLFVQLPPFGSNPACIVASGSASKLIQSLLTVELIRLAGSYGGWKRWCTVCLGVAAFFSGRLLAVLSAAGLASIDAFIGRDAATMYVLLATLVLALLVSLTSRSQAESQAGFGPAPADVAEGPAPKAPFPEVAAEYGLTSREAEVLELLAQGRTQGVIADRLTISKGTAHVHISRVYAKLGVHSQQELLDALEKRASSNA